MTKLSIPRETQFCKREFSPDELVMIHDLCKEQMELYRQSVLYHAIDETLSIFHDAPTEYITALVEIQNIIIQCEEFEASEQDKRNMDKVRLLINLFTEIRQKLSPKYELNPDFVEELTDYADNIKSNTIEQRLQGDLVALAKAQEEKEPDLYKRLKALEHKSQELQFRESELLSSIKKLRIENSTLCKVLTGKVDLNKTEQNADSLCQELHNKINEKQNEAGKLQEDHSEFRKEQDELRSQADSKYKA